MAEPIRQWRFQFVPTGSTIGRSGSSRRREVACSGNFLIAEQVCELGTRADSELAVDPPEVHFDGLDAQEQLGGNLPIGAAPCTGRGH